MRVITATKYYPSERHKQTFQLSIAVVCTEKLVKRQQDVFVLMQLKENGPFFFDVHGSVSVQSEWSLLPSAWQCSIFPSSEQKSTVMLVDDVEAATANAKMTKYKPGDLR